MKRFIDWLGNKTDSTALKERYYLERDVTNETKNKKREVACPGEDATFLCSYKSEN